MNNLTVYDQNVTDGAFHISFIVGEKSKLKVLPSCGQYLRSFEGIMFCVEMFLCVFVFIV